MRKGNFFASFMVVLSILAICLYYVKFISIDVIGLISIVGIGIISLVVFGGTLVGVNAITSIANSFKNVRKIIYSLHVKDADNVWNVIGTQNQLFKNKFLDLDMSNYKREMDRIEEDGMVYNQADFKDYINIDRIYCKVNKKYLDVIGKIIILVLIIIVMAMVYFFAEAVVNSKNIDSDDISKLYVLVKVVEKIIKPIVVLNVFSFVLLLEYVVFYKTSLAKMENEYNLFVSDFEKYVMPNAKNDLINNILYLQQLSIQNTKRVLEDGIDTTHKNIKDIIIRNSESASEIDRHIENIGCSLNKFNQTMEELKLSINDQVECTKLLNDNQINMYKEVLESFEKRFDSLIEEIKLKQSNLNASTEIVELKDEDKDKKASSTKTTKATAKKSTTKKTTTKKKKTETEKEEEKTVEPVVRKKRGRKSKAEKEAELKAALEAVIQEADTLANNIEEIKENQQENAGSVEETNESQLDIVESIEEVNESQLENEESIKEANESQLDIVESIEEVNESQLENIEKIDDIV